jgi:hypothetical protein
LELALPEDLQDYEIPQPKANGFRGLGKLHKKRKKSVPILTYISMELIGDQLVPNRLFSNSPERGGALVLLYGTPFGQGPCRALYSK